MPAHSYREDIGDLIATRGFRPDAIAEGKQMVRAVERWYVDFDKCIPYFAAAAGVWNLHCRVPIGGEGARDGSLRGLGAHPPRSEGEPDRSITSSAESTEVLRYWAILPMPVYFAAGTKALISRPFRSRWPANSIFRSPVRYIGRALQIEWTSHPTDDASGQRLLLLSVAGISQKEGSPKVPSVTFEVGPHIINR